MCLHLADNNCEAGLDGNRQVDLVADTLKKFLRDLPEPLAPTVHYRPLIAVAVDCEKEPE